jgi:hypothetical protein
MGATRFTPPARLPRDVPEKSEGFPGGAPPDHSELQTLVLINYGLPRSTRKSLRFFRPITERVGVIGALFRSEFGCELPSRFVG